ncbi:MAG: hypothetical protein M1836_002761 [Candelina mexicana]|nr:MAG: hypothetical protein M1836_002761 [Candelina mexicana]
MAGIESIDKLAIIFRIDNARALWYNRRKTTGTRSQASVVVAEKSRPPSVHVAIWFGIAIDSAKKMPGETIFSTVIKADHSIRQITYIVLAVTSQFRRTTKH